MRLETLQMQTTYEVNKGVKVCEYSRSRSFHDDLILQDQASQDQWSSGVVHMFFTCTYRIIFTWHSTFHTCVRNSTMHARRKGEYAIIGSLHLFIVKLESS